MYELAAAIAATGREVELRGKIDQQAFEEICSAAGARPILDPAPRLPSAADTVIFAEGWPNPLYAPYVLSGARCVMMLLGPPGFAGWPYTEEPWEKPDPLTLDPATLARPEHFRAIAGLGCEMWTHSRGLQSAALEAGTVCTFIGSGQPRPFPQPGPKEVDMVMLEHNRWASLAADVAEAADHSLLRVPMADHDEVLRRLGSARVLVWPSRVEGHSRIQVEARAMGTVPVALSNRFAEGLGREGGAVLVESLDEMAPAIRELLASPEELSTLAARAQETARAQVQWEPYLERVEAALAAPAPPREGAAARDRIFGELARTEYRLRARIAELSANGGPTETRLARLARRVRGRRPSRPHDAATGAPPAGERKHGGRPTVYVAGGYLPRGGAYMAYHLGRIVAERFDHDCRVVVLKDESPDHGRWQYPRLFETVSRAHMEAEIGDGDLLIANPSFSRNRFGLRLPGRKLMYVQGFGRFPELDGFFDGYVCASDFLRDLLRTVYDIEAPVIPPFVHLDRIPAGEEWSRRPAQRVLVATKSSGHALLARMQELMRRNHPEARHRLSVVQPMAHAELLERMAEHRYFLSLSPREGFGITQLEAMAAGCTVVGFHGGGGGQFMRAGFNCEAAAYPAIDELCERLAKVLCDDEHARQLAERGRETATGFDLATFEERWTTFLEGFVAGPVPRT